MEIREMESAKMERLTINYDGHWVPRELCTVDREGGADDCEPCHEDCIENCDACAVQKCFDRLAAYEDTRLTPGEIMDGKMLTGWIPVDEKLPGETEFYLVTRKMDRSDDLVVSVMWFNSEKKTWELFSSEAHKGIIAWMLLPEPAKGE